METSGVNLEQVIVHNDSDADEADLKPKKIKLKKPQKPKQIHEHNPNVLGFESSSSEDEETESDEENEPSEDDSKSVIENEPKIEDKENVIEDEKPPKDNVIISKDNNTNLSKVEKSPAKETIEEKTIFVPVSRTPQVVEARSKLPIIDIEHDIVDKIRHNDVVIITGETGSGKTTQGIILLKQNIS